jgi:hypothetical protein
MMKDAKVREVEDNKLPPTASETLVNEGLVVNESQMKCYSCVQLPVNCHVIFAVLSGRLFQAYGLVVCL